MAGLAAAAPRNPSYTGLKRDILYRAINEFQLSGSRLSAYDDLLSRLNMDLSPSVSRGHTWYLCRGRKEDRSACERMVPEVYLRTAVGKLLKTADRMELRGEDLIEELANALSYAICSEHNRNVHKVVRAIKFLPVVEQWREERPMRTESPGAAAMKDSPTVRSTRSSPDKQPSRPESRTSDSKE